MQDKHNYKQLGTIYESMISRDQEGPPHPSSSGDQMLNNTKMKLQDIKSKLYNFVIAEEDEFIIYNRQGVVIKEMTLQEVEDAIVNCESIKELANLIMEDWLYKDVYASFKELLADASAKRY